MFFNKTQNLFLSLSLVLILVGFTTTPELAEANGKKGHSAHVHGQGHLRIAFDDKTGALDLDLPAESLFGFEHEPKNEQQKAKIEEGLNLLKEKAQTLFVFQEQLKCSWKANPKIEVIRKKNHADIKANFEVECEASPAGTLFKVQTQKDLPRLRRLNVEFAIGEKQGKASIRQGAGEIQF